MSRRSFAIEETRRYIYARDGGRCQFCFGPGWQLAHKLPQDKLHKKRYGEAVIYHPSNMTLTCDRCNFRAEVDYRSRPIEAEKIAREIRAEIQREKP
jgi:5-methylcytosine-specific restriction endonuclease McrA